MNLSKLTVIATGLPSGSEWSPELVDVEILDETTLDPKETRAVNIVSLFDCLVQELTLSIQDTIIDSGETANDFADHTRLIYVPFSPSCDGTLGIARSKTPRHAPSTTK